MCGIAGLITPSPDAARQALAAMDARQCHRGPDDAGQEFVSFGSAFLGLGHRRLAILDLSPMGHQPMIHPQTGDQIIFNGEIYNFAPLRDELISLGSQFKSHSDTEVLLHGLSRWGEKFIARLAGMFAFAFYDRKNNRVILARDSIGIKPLYVAATPQHFLFASEVRALLASNLIDRKINQAGIASLLAYGCVQHPQTLFNSIQSFPPGHYQIIHARNGQPQFDPPTPFWNFPAPDAAIDQASAISLIDRTMNDAIRDHLVADVPVGVFLSSGLDSTIVAALASKFHPKIRSFTVAFADQPQLSEGPIASQTANLFGMQHTDIQITGNDAENACIQWLQSLDQPNVDGLNVYVLSQAVRQHCITVALAGNGGDELFGGYPSFADVPKLRQTFKRINWLPSPLRRSIAQVAAARKPRAVRQKLKDMASGDPTLLDLYLHRRRAMSDHQLAALGLFADQLGLSRTFQPPDAVADLNLLDEDPVWSISQLETRFYQHNMLLRDGDVNGMAHSLEIRVPMLDQRLIDLANRIPGPVRLPNHMPDKHLLRQAFHSILRPQLLQRKKMGFTLPIAQWMVGPLRELCEASLAHLKSLGVLQPTGIDDVWNAFLTQPDSPIWSRAFTLVVLGSYLKQTV